MATPQGKECTDYHKSAAAGHGYLRREQDRRGKILASRFIPEAVILRISGISMPSIQSPPEVWPFMADQRIEFIHRDDVVTALCAAIRRKRPKDKSSISPAAPPGARQAGPMSKTTLTLWVFPWMKPVLWKAPAGATGTTPIRPRTSCTTRTPLIRTIWTVSEQKSNG